MKQPKHIEDSNKPFVGYLSKKGQKRFERRIKLVKDFEKFSESEKNRLGDKFRNRAAVIKFSRKKGLHYKTTYKHLRAFKLHGIAGLAPKSGRRIKSGPVARVIIPMLPDAILPGQGYVASHQRILEMCRDEGVKAPSYSTFCAIIKKEGLSDIVEGCRKRSKPYSKTFKMLNTTFVTMEFDKTDPLALILQIGSFYKDIEFPSDTIRRITEKAFEPFEYINSIPPKRRYCRMTLNRPLAEDEVEKLEKIIAGNNEKRRIKAKAILMVSRNYSLWEIVHDSQVVWQTVYKWIQKFKVKGPDFVYAKKDRKKNDEELRNRNSRLIKILRNPPGYYGINRTTWIQRHIIKVYESEYGKKLGKGAIQKFCKDEGFQWRSARRVMVSNDSEYEKKVRMLGTALHGLGPNDRFFFIDEAGPWQVRKYGGKSLTRKGERKTYPQFQQAKGRVTFVGALDALKNQVIWFFTRSKNTGAVICLIKILYYKYYNFSELCLTWDCASWHRSKSLDKEVAALNEKVAGPTIKIVPLPKRAQYLNIIESIFSGLKSAVIHNSDYESVYDMKRAIDQHFRSRNEYYKKNPKRAGNKIWDREYFNLDEFESGLHKKTY